MVVAISFSQTAQHHDTLDIPQVVITANRSNRNIVDIPGSLAVIDRKTIESLPVQNSDEILKYVANVYVNRSWGVFSQNSSVTMRGLDASERVLVLLDGVPLNKSAGGSINWHLISPHNIERIEVLKGAASAMYGNNAMAGVINIITKNPIKQIEAEVGLSAATYNTYGGHLNLGGKNIKHNKGLTWKLNSFYRQGDGYFLTPEAERDSNDARAGLMEYNVSAKLGYQFNENQQIEIEGRLYSDSRGQGTKVYEELGDHMSVTTMYYRANYQGVFNKTKVNALAFYQNEMEFKQSETISSNSGKYKLSERESLKDDYGLWMNATTFFSDKHILTYGLDLKQGWADVTTTYKTSTDVLRYQGVLDFFGLFAQDEIKLLDEKLVLVAGARLDYSSFYKGQLSVENPTSNTGFVAPSDEEYPRSSWYAFSPKIAVNYHFMDDQSAYLSYSQGFKPPKLDDLSKSGKIRKGFKLANPDLKPEYLTNYEGGAHLSMFHHKLKVEPAIYYSLGKDFQYFVGTGDSVDTGGDDLKPVYQRRNISNVEIIGGEIALTCFVMKQLQFMANYSYNHSTIKDYDKPDYYDSDLTGKYLIEVPKHMALVGLGWKNKFFHATASYQYVGSQWYDDENTVPIDAYDIIDLQLSKVIANKLTLTLIIQNLLDNQYIDRKGYLSPGRFITGEVTFSL